MSRNQGIAIFIAVAIVGFIAGYIAALPGGQAVAPNAQNNAITGTSTSGGAAQEQNGASTIAVSVVSIRNTSNPLYKITGEYPQFGNASAEFNASISNFVNTNLAEFTGNAQSAAATSGTAAQAASQSFAFDVSWQPEQINNNYISAIVRISYNDGGLGTTNLLQTFNYNVTPGEIMTLGDLFPKVSNYLSQIAQLAQQQITNNLSQQGGNAPNQMIEQGTAPSSANYANFMFNDDTVTIYFPQDQVAPASDGEQQVTFTRAGIQ